MVPVHQAVSGRRLLVPAKQLARSARGGKSRSSAILRSLLTRLVRVSDAPSRCRSRWQRIVVHSRGRIPTPVDDRSDDKEGDDSTDHDGDGQRPYGPRSDRLRHRRSAMGATRGCARSFVLHCALAGRAGHVRHVGTTLGPRCRPDFSPRTRPRGSPGREFLTAVAALQVRRCSPADCACVAVAIEHQTL